MTAPRAAIFGWPVKHSRSPLIHNYWLALHGLEGSYVKAPVPPEEIAATLAHLDQHGYIGGNVTIPHKEAAFAACAHVDPIAAELGVLNTIWLQEGELHGANTDVPGFLMNLDQMAPGWDANPAEAVMLGAGGAARAVLHGLISRGFAVHITNRTLERAQALADFYPGRATAHRLSETETLLPTARVLVNTTSLGMEGQPPLDLDLAPVPSDALVTDIVYVPLETPILKLARARELKTVDGLGMLLHQAVPGFETWFGVRPTVTDDLRALIVADLGPTA